MVDQVGSDLVVRDGTDDRGRRHAQGNGSVEQPSSINVNGHVSLTDNGAQRPNRIWIDYGPSPYVVCVFQPYKPNRRLPRLTIPDGATDRVEIWGGADAREDAREEASQTRKTTDFMSIH